MNTAPGQQPSPHADFESIIRLENVQKSFGAVQALRNVNVAIGRN